MRYHVRTDSLKDVLADKEMFYPNENSLVAEDWTEMSGYLMDKLYGELSPQEEYLREKIEDVHSMLVRAVKKDPVNPISRYNISRYYIESGDHLRAIEGLKKTLELMFINSLIHIDSLVNSIYIQEIIFLHRKLLLMESVFLKRKR